jgi:chromosome segregation ATPase
MPLASGSKKAKLKDKGKAAKKKGQKTSVAPSESCLSPAISPTLDPELQQQAVLDPESLPPLPDSVQLSPESAEIYLAAGRSPSPKDPLTSSFHSAYVEDEGTEEEEEAVELRPEMVPQSTDPAPDKPAEDSSDPQEEHHPFEAEKVLDDLEKELHTADAPTEVAAEQKPESPEGTILEDADSSGPALPPPPAPKPLPSPSPTNANSTRSPGPEHQPAHRGSSSVTAWKSPVYKYASPPMHPYSPYMMNAHPHMMHPGGSVHPSSASFATAYHSPNMEHASMGSPYGYGKRSGSIATGTRDYYHAGMDPPRTNGNANGHRELDDGPLEDDSHDAVHLLTRIEKVMPDLSRLLHSFKDTRGKLTAREAEARQLEAQHEQALMHKDFYIEALQAQMKKSATETAEELSKLRNTINELRLELGNLQEKLKDMEENLTTSRNERDELSQARAELEGEIENLQTTIRELQVAHEMAIEGQKEHERAELATQKEELTSLFEEIRAEDEKAANDKYNTRENELLDEQESMKSAWDQEKQQMEEAGSTLQTEHEAAMNDKQTELDGKAQELNDAQLQLERTMEQLEARKSELESQKNELLSKQGELDSKITELEAKHAELETTRAEVTTKQSKIEEKHKELDEIRQKHAVELEQLTDSHRRELDNLQETHSNERQGDRDLHAVELSGLKDTHEGQLAAALKEAEEKWQALLVQVQEKEKNWESHRLSLERQLVEKVDELATLEREREALERNDVARERQLQTAVDEMRRTIDNMESDREKLRKTLQSLGEATDLKSSKGDPFL